MLELGVEKPVAVELLASLKRLELGGGLGFGGLLVGGSLSELQLGELGDFAVDHGLAVLEEAAGLADSAVDPGEDLGELAVLLLVDVSHDLVVEFFFCER